jgi:ferritin-like protein
MVIDRQIVDSSESMREIMKATQEEAKHSRFMAKQSQEMAEDMRRDSTSMKAVSDSTCGP